MNTPQNVGTILITGAAQRIGAALSRALHAAGYRILVHYHSSQSAAAALVDEMNQFRAGSAVSVQAALHQADDARSLAKQVRENYPDLSALINNAASFYPTPLSKVSDADWDRLMGSNLQGPFLLCQGLAELLRQNRGCIINIIDVYAGQPLPNYNLYCASKAGLGMLTRSLAAELAPDVRVNGIAPGAILWPHEETGFGEKEKQALLTSIPLARLGDPDDIAALAKFLITDGTYITGQTIAVDGGKSA